MWYDILELEFHKFTNEKASGDVYAPLQVNAKIQDSNGERDEVVLLTEGDIRAILNIVRQWIDAARNAS